ncbi:hypothetical protein CROQUDRAFT_671869 [Cronartium quercuum f. sp. fusiforme G11]|uniref:Nucleolar protein 16 n=1 Tax=Cronartium quercuum f. sp. fusiforme G11 TaxID=708437 RepID=A0A9P6TAI2_9BASI|nr:hypothetical protein CROQUDRAFT_671869 [Cronartium quercuum f. sp. fusiforme G11]
MANPRQRRKSRSGNHRVRISKHANSRLKKVTPQNFPAGLAAAYDRKQTPAQNYRRLGLLSGKLQPRLSGGIEKDTSLSKNWLTKVKNPDEWDLMENDEDEDEDEVESAKDEDSENEERSTSDVKASSSNKLSKGEGRIVRGADGNILKVILGDETDIEIENHAEDPSSIVIVRPSQAPKTKTPWGDPLEPAPYERPAPSKPTRSGMEVNVPQGLSYQNPRQGKVEPKTSFVAQLEQISVSRVNQYTQMMKAKQYLSENQVKWIMKLVDKHGIDNVNAMAKDIKLNTHQKTEGEIRHMISKLVKS